MKYFGGSTKLREKHDTIYTVRSVCQMTMSKCDASLMETTHSINIYMTQIKTGLRV